MKVLTLVLSFVICSLVFVGEIKTEGEIVGRCIVPEAPLFGSISIDYKKSKITYDCEEGFNRARGSRSRRCKKITYEGSSYYDWTGTAPTCFSKDLYIRECPFLEKPQNGDVIVSSYEIGGQAEYLCDPGHALVGPQTIRCGDNLDWSGGYPSCQARNSANDFAEALKDKFVDKYAPSGPSEGKLKAGKSGLDLIFAIDVSESIGDESLNNAKQFVKVIVEKFGISNDSQALNGTRISVMTFSDTTKTLFNFDDKKVRSIKKVNRKIDKIKTSGGGTDFVGLLRTLLKNHLKYFGPNLVRRNPKIKERKENANRAIFIITDAEETTSEGGKEKTSGQIKKFANNLKMDHGYEIFAIGVGTQIQKSLLAEIASPPYLEHVFLIENLQDLKTIGETIAEENIDYGKCGISGNTQADKNGVSKEAAWPWIGWYSVVKSSGSMITCGGVLLCDEWFLTLASCVTEISGHDIVTLEDRINLYLADHSTSIRDDHEIMVPVTEVAVHPNFTGETNEYGVRPYDIALLRLGQDNTTRPTLNKYIKPICFLEIRDMASYTQGKTLLSFLKSGNRKAKGVVAGWGHMGKQKVSGLFPWGEMKQYDSNVVSDRTCKTKYRHLDSDMFYCVGNIHQAASDYCPADIGGPLMRELEIRRYAVLGLAVKTTGCLSDNTYDFNIFLNVFHPEISTWAQSILRGCNRLDEFIPYVEPEINDNANDSDAGDANAVDDAHDADVEENDENGDLEEQADNEGDDIDDDDDNDGGAPDVDENENVDNNGAVPDDDSEEGPDDSNGDMNDDD